MTTAEIVLGNGETITINKELEKYLKLKWETSLIAAVELIEILGECVMLATDPDIKKLRMDRQISG
ncbi:hypothetical protein TWF481_012215 [Arthrobotrys musiformis]|uniref:Uncharacterized protein n=1 Tax=Arthrobotrys musiformis TaxID=47236 RepID=A0AAV9VYH0_9PEZI